MICVYRCTSCGKEVELIVNFADRQEGKKCTCKGNMMYIEIPKSSEGVKKNHRWKRMI